MRPIAEKYAQIKLCHLHLDKRVLCQVHNCMAWNRIEQSEFSKQKTEEFMGYCNLVGKK